MSYFYKVEHHTFRPFKITINETIDDRLLVKINNILFVVFYIKKKLDR
jgi:hypothetical protein